MCRGGSLGSGAQLSGCKRHLSEWFVLLRLILGAAPGPGEAAVSQGPGFGKKKGPRHLNRASAHLTAHSPHNAGCWWEPARPGAGGTPGLPPAATHPQLWLNGQGRGAGSSWHFFFSVLSSGKVRSQDAEPPGTVTWHKRVQEWVSSARTEEGPSDPGRGRSRPALLHFWSPLQDPPVTPRAEGEASGHAGLEAWPALVPRRSAGGPPVPGQGKQAPRVHEPMGNFSCSVARATQGGDSYHRGLGETGPSPRRPSAGPRACG